jgi:hypothetical protein
MNYYTFEGVVVDILEKKTSKGRPYSLFIVEDDNDRESITRVPFYRCNEFMFIQKGMRLSVTYRLDCKEMSYGPTIDVQVISVTELGVDNPRTETCKRLQHIFERNQNLETPKNQYRERKRQFEHKGK